MAMLRPAKSVKIFNLEILGYTVFLYLEQVSTLQMNLIPESTKRIGRKVTRNKNAFRHMKKPNTINCGQKG